MAEARINAEELSRRTGLPASTIKKIRNGDNANPTLSTLSPLARYFSLSISQLIGDEPFPSTRIKGSYCLNPETLSYIPLLTWAEAIDWPATRSHMHATIATEHKYSDSAFALLVEEDGWENLSKDTALLADPALSVDHRDYIIVYKKDQKLPTLKQALFDEGQMYLKPITHQYNITRLTPEHKILGVVVEYKKHLKKS